MYLHNYTYYVKPGTQYIFDQGTNTKHGAFHDVFKRIFCHDQYCYRVGYMRKYRTIISMGILTSPVKG